MKKTMKKTETFEGRIFQDLTSKRKPIYLLEGEKRRTLEDIISQSGIVSKVAPEQYVDYSEDVFLHSSYTRSQAQKIRDDEYLVKYATKDKNANNWKEAKAKILIQPKEVTDPKDRWSRKIDNKFLKKALPKVRVTITIEEIE